MVDYGEFRIRDMQCNQYLHHIDNPCLGLGNQSNQIKIAGAHLHVVNKFTDASVKKPP